MSKLIKLTRKDFQSDQDVRWCPGCGDYVILAQLQRVLAEMGADIDKTVFISGIGCSSRFPYYMSNYGLHGIHGRAPAIASGLKIARPDLDVWVATGDGDALAIGGNHLIHALRRNVGLKILLFNNRIYGLTKGQFSPTSEQGKRSPSTPLGSTDRPFDPLALTLGAGASFVARTLDSDAKHLQATLKRAAEHQGSAFVEIYQNCLVFNDKAFAHVTDKNVRADRQLQLEHGKPLLFGKERDRAIVFGPHNAPEVVEVGEGEGQVPLEQLPVHDETVVRPGYGMGLAGLSYPDFPIAVGVLRAVEQPSFEVVLRDQEQQAKAQLNGKPADLESLWTMGDCWEVEGAAE